MKPSHFSLALTWLGLLGLIATVISWMMIHPPPVFGIWLGVFLIAPLIIPIRGLIQRRPYTYAAMSLVSLLYIMIGMMEGIANPPERPHAYAMLISGGALFLGCITFVRLNAAEQRRKQAVGGQSESEHSET